MSTSYKRATAQALAKCDVPGCGWKSLFFERDGYGVSHVTRAKLSLAAHKRAAHGPWIVVSSISGAVLCSEGSGLTEQQARNVVENNARHGYRCEARRVR